MISGDILRGHTDTIILGFLTKGDNYGYEISKFIMQTGEGIIEVKDATIYQAFRRMEKEELIAAYWGDTGLGARRRYYKITDKGKECYDNKKKEWVVIKRVLNNLIIGGVQNEQQI